jgi:hypothetical protein
VSKIAPTINLSDTSPAAERLQIERMRQAPAWYKAYLVGRMTETVRILNLTGLRQHYPQATPDELRRLLADLWLGPELAERVYGPLPEEYRHAA